LQPETVRKRVGTLEQPERVPGWCSIEYHYVEPVFVHEVDEAIE